MGNNTSTTHSGQHDSPKSLRRDTGKHPIPVQNRRVAAPPEPSLAQAQGTIPHPTQKYPPSLPIVSPLTDSPASPLTSPSGADTPAHAAGEYSTISPQTAPKTGAINTFEPAKPLAVPVVSKPGSAFSRDYEFDDSRADPLPSADDREMASTTNMHNSSIQDMSYLTRPPRMPLPIEEEVHTPGSPITPPVDVGEPLEDIDNFDSEGLPRRSSTLSSSTIDEEDMEELRVDRTRPTVPTRLEWLRGGDKVYVTGTIFQWNRKTRLHPVEGRPGVFATTVNILPGTHHIRFLVDGQMTTSRELPTTVDFGNNLVNYIEVSPEDAHDTKDGQRPAGPKLPAPHVPQRYAKDIPPASTFTKVIPEYLLDFDQPEDSPAYQSATSALEKLSNPPALPGFLARPILNAATLIKDDNSVLNMPNHTVLNHLMTSSIKNNILAVSGTTRYKNKYVTTIIYKPTSADSSGK